MKPLSRIVCVSNPYSVNAEIKFIVNRDKNATEFGGVFVETELLARSDEMNDLFGRLCTLQVVRRAPRAHRRGLGVARATTCDEFFCKNSFERKEKCDTNQTEQNPTERIHDHLPRLESEHHSD